jgi:Helix-turn-helix domain
MEQPFSKTGYFDLQALAGYSCCSVRWLRDRLVDRTHPLPHHRVGGKLLVKKEDFEQWISQYRQERPADELEGVVNGVLAKVGR